MLQFASLKFLEEPLKHYYVVKQDSWKTLSEQISFINCTGLLSSGYRKFKEQVGDYFKKHAKTISKNFSAQIMMT